jgi:hypothetical protein
MASKKLAAIDSIKPEERDILEHSVDIRGILLGRDEKKVYLRMGNVTAEIPLDSVQEIEGDLKKKTPASVSVSADTNITLTTGIKADQIGYYGYTGGEIPVSAISQEEIVQRVFGPGIFGIGEGARGTGSPMYVTEAVLAPTRTRGVADPNPKYVTNPVILAPPRL